MSAPSLRWICGWTIAWHHGSCLLRGRDHGGGRKAGVSSCAEIREERQQPEVKRPFVFSFLFLFSLHLEAIHTQDRSSPTIPRQSPKG